MNRDEDTAPWLICAYSMYDHQFVKKVKDFYYVAPLQTPMPLFWSLNDQQVCYIILNYIIWSAYDKMFKTLKSATRYSQTLFYCQFSLA